MLQPLYHITKSNIIFKKKKTLVSLTWNKYFFFFTLHKSGLFKRAENKSWPYVYRNYINTFIFYFRYFSFIGKSYKISFSKTCINLNFNKSNINYLVPCSTIWMKSISKNKIFFKTPSLNTLSHLFKSLIRVRLQNMFTGRGIKLSQSILLKKKGKVSSYTSQTGIF